MAVLKHFIFVLSALTTMVAADTITMTTYAKFDCTGSTAVTEIDSLSCAALKGVGFAKYSWENQSESKCYNLSIFNNKSQDCAKAGLEGMMTVYANSANAWGRNSRS